MVEKTDTLKKEILKQLQEARDDESPMLVSILGIVGLFFWVIPGIILFITAMFLSSSKSKRIRYLKIKLIECGGK